MKGRGQIVLHSHARHYDPAAADCRRGGHRPDRRKHRRNPRPGSIQHPRRIEFRVMPDFDAIAIPGGGVRAGGELPPWVTPRLDRALAIARSAYSMPLSGGTPHRIPPWTSAVFRGPKPAPALAIWCAAGRPQTHFYRRIVLRHDRQCVFLTHDPRHSAAIRAAPGGHLAISYAPHGSHLSLDLSTGRRRGEMYCGI